MSAFTDWWAIEYAGWEANVEDVEVYKLACEEAFNAGLEAAAKVCESAHPNDWPFNAQAIRALKEE